MPERRPNEPFTRLSVKEAQELRKKPETAVFDVRQPGEWAQGHLEGAKLIPVDSLFERIGELPEDGDLLFYCAAGVRSALACEIAAAMGRTRVYNMEGGVDSWKAGGLPLVKDAPPAHR